VTDDNGGNDHGREVVGRWYANSFDVGHNAFEFKVDCGQERPDEEISVYFRVIASPFNARELFRLLGTSLLRYADTFGPIDDKTAHGPRRDV
jgi:uncharacterized protein DUF3467